MRRIGFFGLTGNPPHFAHCYAIGQALKQTDMVYVSLVYKHPFGKSFIDYHHRQNMLDIIIKEYFTLAELEKIKILEIDKEYCNNTGQIPYSYNLLKELKNKQPQDLFSLVIGRDNYVPATWAKFFKYKEIEDEFNLIVIEEKNLHSTQIRELMKKIDLNKGLIVDSCGSGVFHYMKNNDLY